MNWKFVAGWITIIAAAAALEATALIAPGKDDTFSELVWSLLQNYPFLWVPAVGGFVWLGVHLFRRNKI